MKAYLRKFLKEELPPKEMARNTMIFYLCLSITSLPIQILIINIIGNGSKIGLSYKFIIECVILGIFDYIFCVTKCIKYYRLYKNL